MTDPAPTSHQHEHQHMPATGAQVVERLIEETQAGHVPWVAMSERGSYVGLWRDSQVLIRPLFLRDPLVLIKPVASKLDAQMTVRDVPPRAVRQLQKAAKVAARQQAAKRSARRAEREQERLDSLARVRQQTMDTLAAPADR